MEKNFDQLRKNYITPGHPTAFGGVQTVYRYYKPLYTQKEIKYELSKIPSYTLHKETKKTPRNPFFVFKRRQQFQVDLIEMKKTVGRGGGKAYLLTCIDVGSKYAWARTMKSKRADEVLGAFEDILSDAEDPPETLLSDRGSEFKNRMFMPFCQERGIRVLFPNNEVKAAVVERFNKTLQTIAYKYLTEYNVQSFSHHLPKFMKTYNNRYHSTIKMTPTEAEASPEKLFAVHQQRFSKFKRKKPKYAVGERVRISILKGKFHRSYKQQFKVEQFLISRVHTRMPIPTYSLTTLDGSETLEGTFYENEITPVRGAASHFTIDKVLKTRKKGNKKEYYVKWKGYDDTYNTWVPQSHLDT